VGRRKNYLTYRTQKCQGELGERGQKEMGISPRGLAQIKSKRVKGKRETEGKKEGTDDEKRSQKKIKCDGKLKGEKNEKPVCCIITQRNKMLTGAQARSRRRGGRDKPSHRPNLKGYCRSSCGLKGGEKARGREGQFVSLTWRTAQTTTTKKKPHQPNTTNTPQKKKKPPPHHQVLLQS